MPYLKAACELKTKPTQHSVGQLRQIGIQPDILICRTETPIPLDARKKMALHLDGTTIDFQDGPTGRGFAVTNPNAPQGGGCPGCGGH